MSMGIRAGTPVSWSITFFFLQAVHLHLIPLHLLVQIQHHFMSHRTLSGKWGTCLFFFFPSPRQNVAKCINILRSTDSLLVS
ncbi:hypothetical protein BDV38DRAFT_208140 [Aspergillus pseudotamarii]|uniref:Uncharacterized protein n=1 Tax=Aspergillus pseudotamarii TaxID=132259 RepID=A0A5N6SHB4_ASPPS|nr:uncharacterized protein BDV38DRAFT_208140 [Aspergillus pseudotamarii]KAE8132504.1 hypothetical protein BDV38DRAFT_208140 [Aspergillus pseudotamarii]